MPGIEAWLTLAVLALMFIALVREILAPDVVVFAALVMLWGTGVVDTREALAGFSNPQVLAVAFLFIVSAALQETGALARVSRVLLRPDANGNVGLTRMLGPVVGLSAFLNNTPIVGIFAPTIRDWAVRTGRSPSRYLLPLSYAAILGGTCTLIGTSTNLVVSGLLEESGHAGFGMFGLSLVAVPVAVVGFSFLVTLGYRLLPERRSPDEDLRRMREFGVVLQVSPTCSMVGQSVEAAGLRSLSGLFLAEIERGARRIVPVRPTDVVQAGDRLGFYGLAETVVELRRTPGLEPVVAEDDDATEGGTVTAQRPGTARGVFEVVVSAQSPLVGSTLKVAGFRRRYDAAVLAIHRNGERLRSKLGEVELLAGDVLMLEASPGFRKAWGHSDEFYLVAEVDAATGTADGWRAPVSLLVVAAMILVMSVTSVPTVQAAAVAVVLLLVLGAVRPQAARRSLDLNVLVVVASSFGISQAAVNSGLAQTVATFVLDLVGGGGPLAAIAVVWILTAIFTEVLSNNAAAALMFPIALAMGQQSAAASGVPLDPTPWAATVALAASMSFITPIGYQTNLMVYGPGGYRFGDFSRIGVPMALLCFFTAMVCIPLVWDL